MITLDADRRIIPDGAVTVVGDRVTAVGPSVELADHAKRANRVIDCSGRVLMPGMTDAHTHLFQTLGRGIGDGLSLVPWLQNFMFPYANSITRDIAVAGVRLGALQAALSGTTMVVDNHYAPTDTETTLAVADAIEEIGIRGAVARGIFGPTNVGADLMGVSPDLFPWSAQEELAITEACLAERPVGSHVEIWPTPENVVYVDPDLIVASAELAKEAGVRWHTHCSESAEEIGFFESVHGIRPVAWLAREGLLDERTTLAHAIWLDDDEVAAMGDNGASAIHNPVSNQYLASGVLRLAPLLEAGANISLGSDGIAVSGQNMFEAMKSGTLLHRVHNLDPTVTNVEQFLEFATLGGAAMAGLEAGSLDAGQLADIIVLDVDKIHHTPWNHPVASIVHCGVAADIDTVIVGGRIIVEKGRSTLVDEAEVMAEAAEAARRLVREADLSGHAEDWISPPTVEPGR